MRMRTQLFSVGLITSGFLLLVVLVRSAGSIATAPMPTARRPEADAVDASVSRVNQWLRERSAAEQVPIAEPADELTIFRRLSLALHGTIPSLEEVRLFLADTAPDRIRRWTLRMLDDERFATYWSRRVARFLTGTEDGPFLVFRRDRLRDWLEVQLQADRPWDEITTELIAAEGLWTDRPASNFLTAAQIPDEGLDENVLAGRTVRAFLGQRIDCAQCHDHPFDTWKQGDFEGLAAFYGQAEVTLGGVVDRPMSDDSKPVEYEITDPGAEEARIVAARVPFHSEWIPEEGHRRRRLAQWVVHPENRRFERAVANRVWGLMFGRPYHDPVDDLPHPDETTGLLDVLGQEFRTHGSRLKPLIRIIAESDIFRLSSEVPANAEDFAAQMEMNWTVFPLVRLRPEQMIGAMFQAGSIRTVDQQSNLFIRFLRFTNENDFLKSYGDAQEDELLQQSGTIPQALLRMNGRFTREFTKTEAFTAAGNILQYSPEDKTLIDNAFLTCLTRLPTSQERDMVLSWLEASAPPQSPATTTRAEEAEEVNQPEERQNEDTSLDDTGDVPGRSAIVQDLFWILFNSPEFSWNH